MKRSAKSKLLFGLFPALIMLLGLELGARGTGAADAVGLEMAGPLGWTAVADLHDHAVSQPGPRVAFQVSTNGDGLRSPLLRSRRDKGRVALFGESTVFGWGVEDHETLPAHLDDALGDRWEVLNAGQPGYSSEQMVRFAAPILDVYTPDGIAWIHPWNDTSWGPGPDRDVLPDHPIQLRGATRYSHFLRWLVALTGQPRLQPVDHALLALAPTLSRASRRVDHTDRIENLERMHRLTRAADAWLVVVLLPPRHVDALSLHHEVRVDLQETCDRLGVSFLDLSEAPWSDLETVPGDVGHFTSDANRQLAVAMLPLLRPHLEP